MTTPKKSAMDDLALELEVAAELARTAGRAILGLYGSDVPVDYKDGEYSSPVTDADRRANAIICDGLRDEFPPKRKPRGRC